jgi:hypothetical protein
MLSKVNRHFLDIGLPLGDHVCVHAILGRELGHGAFEASRGQYGQIRGIVFINPRTGETHQVAFAGLHGYKGAFQTFRLLNSPTDTEPSGFPAPGSTIPSLDY